MATSIGCRSIPRRRARIMERATILLHRDSTWSRRTPRMMSSIRLRLGSPLDALQDTTPLVLRLGAGPPRPLGSTPTAAGGTCRAGRTRRWAHQGGAASSPAGRETASPVPGPPATSRMNSRPSSPALPPALVTSLSFRRPVPRPGGWLFWPLPAGSAADHPF